MKSNSEIITHESPFLQRLKLYLDERFPLLGHGILIVSYYSSNQFLAHALGHPGAPMKYTFHSVLGAITLLCLFFHLRVFDEHKDYKNDCIYYPERVLQKGLITLTHLKIMGGIAIGVELLLASLCSFAALFSVLIVLAFSLLMLKEFFVPVWLNSHFLVYATTHMLIMPLISLMIWSFATGTFPWHAPGWFILYAFVGFFVTFNWEVSRKIRSPEQERDGVETYTKIFGTYGAAYIVLFIRIIDTGMVAFVGRYLNASLWFYLVLICLYMVCLLGFFQYRFNTNPLTAKRMETYAGMYIIAFDLTLAVELISKNGVIVSW